MIYLLQKNNIFGDKIKKFDYVQKLTDIMKQLKNQQYQEKLLGILKVLKM